MDLPPPPSGSEGAAPGRHWAEVIYRDLCARRIWTDHYDMADGRHRLRDEEEDTLVIEPKLPTGVPDTGDVIDPNADDPTPAEITDPSHPDWVEPFHIPQEGI